MHELFIEISRLSFDFWCTINLSNLWHCCFSCQTDIMHREDLEYYIVRNLGNLTLQVSCFFRIRLLCFFLLEFGKQPYQTCAVTNNCIIIVIWLTFLKLFRSWTSHSCTTHLTRSLWSTPPPHTHTHTHTCCRNITHSIFSCINVEIRGTLRVVFVLSHIMEYSTVY